MNKVLMCALLLTAASAWGAATPRGSAYDSRMQNIPYNTTVINTRAGYITTLVFDADEEVITATAGFPQGWTITPDRNRVGISPAPVKQPVTDADGKTVQKIFTPTQQDWQTNLFVTTTKRDYSLMLNVIDNDREAGNLAFVVRFSYPDDTRRQNDAARLARQQELQAAQEKERIQFALKKSTAPRNWNYTRRVAAGSESITPDFAYDDGRFTYLGFSPQKLIPSPTVIVGGSEQVITPTFSTEGNYRVMVLRSLSPRFVLRYGSQVVGIENGSYGKVTVANGSTVSPDVKLESK
ncbi:P-type conjugative transfer protein VirB9 [Shigella flexneri]|nr:P-type conjugative transfer protein VirB9 [Shigella flexneri]HCS3009522.1 P-type conjugative transfer protein VirB9 [Shigella flexneri]